MSTPSSTTRAIGDHWFLDRFAATTPDKPAVVMAESGAVLTYGELEATSNRVARLLRSHGLKRGDHVAFLIENSPRYFEVVWAARHEMARTVEDVLARRLRALFLDARAAIEAAPRVADVLARELGRSETWKARDLENFYAVARGYVYEGE